MTTKRDELRERIEDILDDWFGDSCKNYTSNDIMAAIDSYVSEVIGPDLPDQSDDFWGLVKLINDHLNRQRQRAGLPVTGWSEMNFHKELIDELKVPSPYSRDNDGTEEQEQQ